MGNNQQFDVVATVQDALTGKVLSGTQAPTPVYSIKVDQLQLLDLELHAEM